MLLPHHYHYHHDHHHHHLMLVATMMLVTFSWAENAKIEVKKPLCDEPCECLLGEEIYDEDIRRFLGRWIPLL